jgi:hypothetical protein
MKQSTTREHARTVDFEYAQFGAHAAQLPSGKAKKPEAKRLPAVYRFWIWCKSWF